MAFRRQVYFTMFCKTWKCYLLLGTQVHLVLWSASVFLFSLLRNERKPMTLPWCCTIPLDYLGMESNSSKVRTCSLRMFYESLTKSSTFKVNSQKTAWFRFRFNSHNNSFIISEWKLSAKYQSINEQAQSLPGTFQGSVLILCICWWNTGFPKLTVHIPLPSFPPPPLFFFFKKEPLQFSFVYN